MIVYTFLIIFGYIKNQIVLYHKGGDLSREKREFLPKGDQFSNQAASSSLETAVMPSEERVNTVAIGSVSLALM